MSKRSPKAKRPGMTDGRYRARWLDELQIVVEVQGDRNHPKARENLSTEPPWRPVRYVATPEGAQRACSTRVLKCEVTGKEWSPAPAPSQVLLSWILAELTKRHQMAANDSLRCFT